VPAQDDADGLRVLPLDPGDVQAELETGPPPGHPRHPAAEARLGQRLAVPGRGQQAMILLSVDDPVKAEVLEEIRKAINAHDVRSVTLP
jgi:hypothetical protein